MLKVRKRIFLLVLFILLTLSAWAHKPLSLRGLYGNAASALQVRDIDVSQVAYYEITPQSPQLWLTFEISKKSNLYLSAGIPVIQRMKDFRPAMAVLGLGLPPLALPFAIPEGYGGWILETSIVKEPKFFHEPFTGTDSWIFREDELFLPGPGRYYIVLYSPQNDSGKLWAAIGKREAFGIQDFLRLPLIVADVRSFHEVKGSPTWLKIVTLILFALAGLVFWRLSRKGTRS